MSDINKIMEAYLGMVSAPQVEETLDEAVKMGPWNRGAINKAMAKAGIKGPQAKAFIAALRVSGTVAEEVESELDEACGKSHPKKESKKLDPVDDKENDKKFKNRKDKDIDNDGDVDSSDEYLHKRRAATDDAIDAKDDEENPVKKNPKTADKKSEISKIESLDLRSDFEKMWSEMAEAIDPKKGATAPEKHDDHSSDHDKKVIGMHKKSDKKVEDQEEKSHDTVFKAAGKDMKQSPARSGADNLSNGDKTIVNPVKGK